MIDSKCENKKINFSILGDSISTFKGFNPYNFPVYYSYDIAHKNGMESVDDTWWGILIKELDANLCVNSSYSGGYVVGSGVASSCSLERTSCLHGRLKPDIILIYMGTNDCGSGVEIALNEEDNINKFYGAYRVMLKRLKNRYPNTKIICGTLINKYLKNTDPKSYSSITVEKYNEAIRLAVKSENCLLADLSSYNESYETLDYCHPTKQGHKLLAQLWLKSIENLNIV